MCRARRGGGGDARVLCVARRHAGCRCVSRVWLHINHRGAWGLIKFPEIPVVYEACVMEGWRGPNAKGVASLLLNFSLIPDFTLVVSL